MEDEKLSAEGDAAENTPTTEELQQKANEAGGRQWNAWEGDAEYTTAQEAAAAKGNPSAITDPDFDLTADKEEALKGVGGRPADRALLEQERREEAAAMREVAREDDRARRESAHDAKHAEKPAEDAVKREAKRSEKNA